MSLRPSTNLTEARRRANRANAQRSTGPRTPEGLARSSRNSLKHGNYADLSLETMLALGEDPEEFESLHAELRAAYDVDDAIADEMVSDLAELYWRKRRWQRASDGLLRTERREWELEQENEEQGRAYQSTTITSKHFTKFGLRWGPNSPAKFRQLAEWLQMIRERVVRRDFAEDLGELFELIYGDAPPWRGQKIWFFWRTLHEAQETGRKLSDTIPQFLEKALGEEIAALREEEERARAARAEIAPAERDVLLMPSHHHAVWLVEQGHKLDRAIDRKIRLLILYRKQKPGAESRGGTPWHAPTVSPEGAHIKNDETKPENALESTKPQAPRRSRRAAFRSGGRNLSRLGREPAMSDTGKVAS